MGFLGLRDHCQGIIARGGTLLFSGSGLGGSTLGSEQALGLGRLNILPGRRPASLSDSRAHTAAGEKRDSSECR